MLYLYDQSHTFGNYEICYDQSYQNVLFPISITTNEEENHWNKAKYKITYSLAVVLSNMLVRFFNEYRQL